MDKRTTQLGTVAGQSELKTMLALVFSLFSARRICELII